MKTKKVPSSFPKFTKGKWKIICSGLAMLVALSLCISCRSKPHQRSDVVGVYVGKYGGGTETFTLLPTGEFTQVAEVDGHITYQNKGHWEWNQKTSYIKFFKFDRCFLSEDGKLMLDKAPDRLDEDTCYWSSDPGQLLFTSISTTLPFGPTRARVDS